MEYLESHNYIHRDLSSRAVLVGENNTAKLCDFQRAVPYDEYFVPKGKLLKFQTNLVLKLQKVN